MGHSEDDAVHKILHKMKTHWQNHLKISVQVKFKILYRIRYKKIDVILVQCTFNKQLNAYVCFVKIHIRVQFSITRCNKSPWTNFIPNILKDYIYLDQIVIKGRGMGCM